LLCAASNAAPHDPNIKKYGGRDEPNFLVYSPTFKAPAI